MSMQSARSLLNSALMQKAALYEQLSRSIWSLLPSDMRAHCWVSGLDKGLLTLVTDSASRIHPLRFMQREIIKLLRDHHGLSVKKIQLKVRPGVKQSLSQLSERS